MSISNNASGYRPGVVANTAQRPSTPYTGQSIYQVDTNQLLVWNGTAWVIPNTPAQNPTGLELVTTTTCSSGGTASNGVVTVGSAVSSIVIGNAFSATYDNYKVIYAGGTATNSTTIYLQFAGITSGYYGARIFASYGGGSASVVGYNNASLLDAGWANTGGQAFSLMDVEIRSPFLPLPITAFNPLPSGDVNFGFANWRINGTTSTTGFTLTLSAGTVSGGTICVYGYRK